MRGVAPHQYSARQVLKARISGRPWGRHAILSAGRPTSLRVTIAPMRWIFPRRPIILLWRSRTPPIRSMFKRVRNSPARDDRLRTENGLQGAMRIKEGIGFVAGRRCRVVFGRTARTVDYIDKRTPRPGRYACGFKRMGLTVTVIVQKSRKRRTWARDVNSCQPDLFSITHRAMASLASP